MKTVYGTRLRYFILVYLLLIFQGLFTCLDMFADNKKAIDMRIACVGIETIVLTTGIVIFTRRINPFKKDILLGQKEVVTYTIIRKTYFDTTGQYYFSFDNPNYMHYEVDAALFHSMNEGDSISIYRGKYSKHVFEKDARFTLM